MHQKRHLEDARHRGAIEGEEEEAITTSNCNSKKKRPKIVRQKLIKAPKNVNVTPPTVKKVAPIVTSPQVVVDVQVCQVLSSVNLKT